ncbi:MAG: threonine/serine exporter family protein [Anaerococcus sp.]
MPFILELIVSYLSSVGFAYLFGCPHKAALSSGIVGSIGWMIYKIASNHFLSLYLSVILSSYVTAILGEAFARSFRMPASMFIIPGIANLAPGSGIYYTLTYFVQEKNGLASDKLVETLLIAGSIAFGITLASAGSKSLRRFKFRRSDRIKYTVNKSIKGDKK